MEDGNEKCIAAAIARPTAMGQALLRMVPGNPRSSGGRADSSGVEESRFVGVSVTVTPFPVPWTQATPMAVLTKWRLVMQRHTRRYSSTTDKKRRIARRQR